MIFGIYRIIMFYYNTKNIQITQKRSIYMSEFTIQRILGLEGSLASEKYISKPCSLVRTMEQVISLIQNHSFYSVFFSHMIADKIFSRNFL